MLEREAERAQIAALIDAARAGFGRVLLIEGPAGIGKSELLQGARESARGSGARVLAAVGGELERDFAFGVVRQLLEGAVVTAAEREQERLFAGAARLARPVFGAGDELGGGEFGGATLHARLHGLYWLVANLAAERPLLVAVDDAQWADAASLRWLSYLARRLEGLPLALAITLRAREPAAEAELLDAIRSLPLACVLRPAPLTVAAVGRLVSDALGREAAPEFARACHAATGGNPFLVRQLADALAADAGAPSADAAGRVESLGPSTVARALVLRLARLPRGSAALAQAVAVLGASTELRDAAALAQLDLDGASRAADALVRVEILAPGRPLRFVHPIVRSAIYDELAPGERASAHARAARLLAERGRERDHVAAHRAMNLPRPEPARLC